MRAVNLIPADSRGGSGARGPSTGMQVPVYVLLGFLAAAVALVTLYVLTNNSISSRTAQLSNLKTEVSQEQAAVARLGEFTKFASLAQTRISTVQSIAAARFDWHTALSDLSKVVPANTTLQSVVGTVVPGATSGGAGSVGTGGIRSAITAPAFELSGCTHSQDDVAKLMSQLRLINGVTRVTISDSQLSNSTSAPTSSGSAAQGCGANTPTFDLVVFFQPVANAGPTGVTSVAGITPATATTSGPTTTPTTSTTTGGTK
jgi:Tfp pilus assembly protein PilN